MSADSPRSALQAVDADFYRGRSVVVTGGTGFLGAHVCRLLTLSGADVVAVGRQAYNLIEQADVRRMYAEQTPDLVIHLAAACGGIGANVKNPGRFLYENALMGLMLLEEGRAVGLQKFVLISTTCAYPKAAPIPLREETIWDGKPVGATGPYGMAKRLLHEAVVTYKQQYGQSGVVLIPANLYGPGDHFDPENSHVVPGMIRRYVEATEAKAPAVTNWGSGTPSREFLHVRDCARAIVLAAARHDHPAPVNLGTGVETPIKQLAETIATATGYAGELRWDTSKPDGQPRRSLDTSRAKAFGFEAKVRLSDGIAETVDWFKTHRPE
ncbi:MAG: nucleoside-diphosphate-sugar epimerase [Bradymonadia bacterium]|jgi:nucleoside-diphosphate-sugar epimerase